MPIFSDTVDSWDDDEELARLKDELPDDHNFLIPDGFDDELLEEYWYGEDLEDEKETN